MDLINEIDRNLFTKILEKSCNLKVNYDYNDIFDGPVIEVDAEEGFHFVQTGSAYYLTEEENNLFPFINYNIKLNEKSILDYYDEYKYIFQGKKYIIPLVYTRTGAVNENNKIRKIIEKINESKLNFKDCIVAEIATSVRGNSLENFIEYVTSKLLIKKGFLVENQVYFYNLEHNLGTVGIPDIGAYRNPNIQNTLIDQGYIENGGFLHELSTLRVFGIKKKTRKLKCIENEYIIGEAKTGSAGQAAFKEKEKYFNWGCFHRFLQITPHQPRLKKWYDYINFFPNGKIEYQPSENPKERTDWHRRRMEEFEQILLQKIKQYLLKNLNFLELLDLVKNHPTTLYNFHRNLVSLDLETIIQYINTVL